MERNGAEIVPMGGGGKQQGIAGMFWRFLVADDPTVDRYIIRDSDSRLNARERQRPTTVAICNSVGV